MYFCTTGPEELNKNIYQTFLALFCHLSMTERFCFLPLHCLLSDLYVAQTYRPKTHLLLN
jgi:hypothetical protein